MSLLKRVFGGGHDDRAPVRPLWRRVVEIAREKQWYAQGGIADTVSGRFDAITLVLSLVLLRMEQDQKLMEPSVRLTEIFVEDMDGQLRQSGVGDLAVGKHIGKLMSVLGGRLGAYREAMAGEKDALLPVIDRNMTLAGHSDREYLAGQIVALARQLEAASAEDILAARIAR